MTKKIWFNSSDEMAGLVVEKPVLAKTCVPEWFRMMPSTARKNGGPFRGRDDVTLKSCMPFLDSITSGYIQRTWTDIYISDDGLSYHYSSSPEPIFIREQKNEHRFPIPDDYAQVEYIWRMPYLAQSSLGSSCLITHPLNRLDLPFYTLSGIIDTDDDFFIRWGSLPFYIKKGFNGLIPAGTPMFQVIPFTRDKWQMVDNEMSEENKIKNESKIHKHFTGAYKKIYRKPKIWQ
jgi:hypothetical protein